MPKIINIPPPISLAPFVRHYSFLQFNTHSREVRWPRYSGPEMCLLFFLEALPKSIGKDHPALCKSESTCSLLKGISTRFNGTWIFCGEYSIFRIHFTPNGFYALFQLPIQEFRNKLIGAQEVFGKTIVDLHVRLRNELCTVEMATLTDAYLETFLLNCNSRRAKNDLSFIANSILKNNCTIPIEQYAAMMKMSVRNFERQFARQVGVSPKLYCRLLRFNRAIEKKLMDPSKGWTEIALDCGYYDQMHMVHDFKKFTGSNPTALFQDITANASN
ncbi:helix-turn-helix domain-containing protein [Aequorivita sp. SDUM287046]|uniref:Helix-turn-helix domain-containing protein n=1 Tax=Aequorivita aurantiaca TaxID=3053356 RepID=A0ABT8DI61_9FLAO|nr:helix-turn-helix domain-containing protein [Aequorivita aurantiaca]MDN3725087.1 helix-turn-helix domain-containing protein [Aequorivita aurantiaca]